mgnify:CR=1 FL=1
MPGLAPRDRAAGLTPVVRKVAAGAAETVPFAQVTNLARALKDLKDAGLWIVGTAEDGEQALGVDARLEDGAVVGALALEHAGAVVQAVREHVDAGLARRHDLAVEPDQRISEIHQIRCHARLHSWSGRSGGNAGTGCPRSAPVAGCQPSDHSIHRADCRFFGHNALALATNLDLISQYG